MSVAAETRGLEEPFKGITANGQIEPGLFGIHSTGVSTKPVVEAARAFLASLTKDQLDHTLYAVDDAEWRKWMNQHFYVRQGVSFLDLSDEQKQSAFGLLSASLSAKGLKLTRDIMRLNHTLGELNGDNFDEYGEWRYHLTVMGKPDEIEPWGWQLDGHHAIVNYFVLGDQVVMTPLFAGSEPVVATSGKYSGTSILQEEQSAGLALINALDETKRAKAILRVSKTGNDNLTEAWKDNVVLDYAGVSAADLSETEREQLLHLIALYVGNMDDGHARVKMDEVREHLARTWFAWIGKTEPGSVFYYRIHSPGDPDRVRSPAAGRHPAPGRGSVAADGRSTSIPWCGRRTGTTTGRTSSACTICSIRTRLPNDATRMVEGGNRARPLDHRFHLRRQRADPELVVRSSVATRGGSTPDGRTRTEGGGEGFVRRFTGPGVRQLRRDDRPGAGAGRRLRLRARVRGSGLDHVRADRGAGGRRGRRGPAHAREHDPAGAPDHLLGHRARLFRLGADRRRVHAVAAEDQGTGRCGPGGDTKRLQLVSVAIMLGAFTRLLANDSIAPLLRDGRLPPIVASVAGGAACLASLVYADRANKPAIREYVLIIALVAGMAAGQITRLAIG